MKRKAYDKLLKWKERGGKTALLVQGARRVGKSYIVEEFAKREYRSHILIDFNVAEKEVKELFENELNDLDSLLMKLSAAYGTRLYERESLIIFDEVQLFPRARSAIKYLVQDGRYDYIETGSLISIRKNVRDILIPSEEEQLNMYPMDFEEYLWAGGNDMLAEYIRGCFEERRPMEQLLHRRAMSLFREYMTVGGMPQAVECFIESKDLHETDRIKRGILALYRDDIRKYAGRYELKVETIFDELPSQLKNQNRHFKLSSLKQGARFDEYKEALFWLSDAMIVNNCYNSTEPSIGLGLNLDRTLLKCYMGDTGLLISHAFNENELVSQEVYKRLLLGKLEVNLGMVTENAAAQMLRASGHRLFFFATPSERAAKDRMEIDFLIAKSKISNRHNISPIEVKSGKRYTLSSIEKFRTKYKAQTDTAYVLHPADLKVENNIVYLPLYMAGLL